jgi:hypothetical protein
MRRGRVLSVDHSVDQRFRKRATVVGTEQAEIACNRRRALAVLCQAMAAGAQGLVVGRRVGVSLRAAQGQQAQYCRSDPAFGSARFQVMEAW